MRPNRRRPIIRLHRPEILIRVLNWFRKVIGSHSALRPAVFGCLLATAVGAAAQTGDSSTPVELGLDEAPSDTFQDALKGRLDPADDEGWRTEVLSDSAHAVLDELIAGLFDVGSLDASEFAAYLGEGFTTDRLRPTDLKEVFADRSLTVRRWAGGRSGQLAGAVGLVEALAELAAGLRLQDPHHTLQKKLKPIRVELGQGAFDTTFLYEVSARHDGGSVQQNAVWSTRWSYPAGEGAEPELLHIRLDSYDETELTAPASGDSTLFVDATAAAMSGVGAYRKQVLPGLDHWFPRVSRLAGMSFLGHHGLALGDVNGDGLEDLYVTDAGGLPNRLYLQLVDGTVRDVSADSGVDWLDPSVSALLVDLDGDTDLDLAVLTAAHLMLHENDGNGRFTLRDSLHEAVTAPASISAADYDEDGDLDLYVCGYSGDRDSRSIPGPVPYQDAKNGGANALLENRGGFRFSDVTDDVGLGENNHSFSFAAAWDDYDDDGDIDLYVANDFGRNNLYENEGGRFRDVAKPAGVQDVASGMAASWGDYDRDGRRDMYVANMFSSAGNRVAYQRRFADDKVSDETLSDIRRMARGNTLFRNVGDGTFDDVTMDAGVFMGLWAWASRFGDLNNDGWLDLVVANGYVTNQDTHDL